MKRTFRKSGIKIDSDQSIADVEEQARQKISWDIANNCSSELGVQKLFLDSREWPGFQKAFNSWKHATWKWVEARVTHEEKSHWRQFLLENRYLFPPDPEQGIRFPVSDFDVERGFQTYLSRRAVFLSSAANRKKSDPHWWKRFAFCLYLAAQLNDNAVFKQVVQLTHKPSKETGQRTLTDWLRVNWFPGCFWAFTKDGISAQIERASITPNRNLPVGRYSEGSIRNAISELRLWRPDKPLYWGLNSKKQLVSL